MIDFKLLGFFYILRRWNYIDGGKVNFYRNKQAKIILVKEDPSNSQRFWRTHNNFIPTKPQALKSGMSVFIHKDCKIARSQVAVKYKKVNDPVSAEVVVVPDKIPHNNFEYLGTGSYYQYYSPIFTNNREIAVGGCTVSDSSDAIRQLHDMGFKELDDSGDCVTFYDTPYIEEYLKGEYDNKIVVTETEIYNSLADNDKSLEDIVQEFISVKDMLNSRTDDTKLLGYKTLATMAYMKYPASASYILSNTIPKGYNAMGTSVAFMFKSLRRYLANVEDTVTLEDFNCLVEILRKVDYMNRLLYLPFVNITKDLQIQPALKT